ncbi:ABC transporter permease [Butyrivibrio sp. AE3004]|uniref:ABC transporter permease n=1 Tax=Butyrivibrio sp. AE3004 TaxID=1506994 RepID=UPI000493E256|nr:ABC transporter permease [Butyrivibrio sp. AE3004]
MKYFLSKILQSLITLFLISIVVFTALRATGDGVLNLLPTNASEEQIAFYTAKLGLDKPVAQQYLIYVRDLLRGDFGTSYTSKRSVIEMIMEKLPYTMELAICAILVAFVISIIFGSLSAVYEGTFFDRLVCGTCALLQAVPTFFIAIILIQFIGVKLKLLPFSGASSVKHLIMPGGVLGIAVSSGMTNLLRNNMIHALKSDFIKFERLNGLRELSVILRHALRNSFASLLSMSSFIFAHLIAGSIAIETVFAWPGLGTLSYTAVTGRDFPLVQGIVIILSTFTILLSLLMDVISGLIDPRLRTGR